MSCLRYPAAAQEARIEHLVVLNVHFVRDERDLHLNSQQRKVYFRQTFQHDGEGQETGSNKMSIMAHPSVVEFSTICDESVHPTARKFRERAKLYKPNAMEVFCSCLWVSLGCDVTVLSKGNCDPMEISSSLNWDLTQ